MPKKPAKSAKKTEAVLAAERALAKAENRVREATADLKSAQREAVKSDNISTEKE